MVDKSELLRVPAFADLPDDQIAWFLSQAQETHIKAGDTYVRQGDPADWMFVILEGQFQWRGEFEFAAPLKLPLENHKHPVRWITLAHISIARLDVRLLRLAEEPRNLIVGQIDEGWDAK